MFRRFRLFGSPPMAHQPRVFRSPQIVGPEAQSLQSSVAARLGLNPDSSVAAILDELDRRLYAEAWPDDKPDSTGESPLPPADQALLDAAGWGV